MQWIHISLSYAAWKTVLSQVRGIALLEDGLIRINALYSVADCRGDEDLNDEDKHRVLRWLTALGTSGRAKHVKPADGESRKFKGYVGKHIISQGNGLLLCSGFYSMDKEIAVDELISLLLPSYSMRDISKSWFDNDFGLEISGDVWVYVQDRYLFKYRGWKDSISRLMRHVGARMASEVTSVNLIFVTEECDAFVGDKYLGSLDDAIQDEHCSWEWQPELSWNFYQLDPKATEERGRRKVALDYHCRYVIWPDLTLQFARGISHGQGDLWVRAWCHFSLIENLELTYEQLRRFDKQRKKADVWISRRHCVKACPINLECWGI